MAGESGIGSALVIPKELLQDIDNADKRLKKLQETARATATVVNNSFASMTSGTKFFAAELQNIINSLQGIGTAANNAANAVNNMGNTGMQNANRQAVDFGASITQAAENINRMAEAMRKAGIVSSETMKGTGNVTKSALQAAREQARINLINQQTATITEKANLEIAKQQKLQAQAATEAAKLARAQAQLAQAQAMAATATERANAANERAARRATIRQYSQSASSALGYANNAANVATFNQRATAIKVLEEAMKNLNRTDANYSKNLAELSARYKQLKADQDQLVSSYRNIQASHRGLMNTTEQLKRAIALTFSVSQIKGYIENIAKVRGEFELQQRSLQAILQNKTQADAIFNKTVAMAVQSPFSIRELVSYTKQLAAYRIESDKLYDTTYRLANVSAGLGVDMQRLILAYGQVKAAAYLRGSEVRQFTEAGVNMYGELQKLFKERDQADYTTAQIVDMISKRMVTFEDVEQVLHRLTDQGGIFYRMQETQAETLQGKIANFKDSIDVMMNEIGKDNEGLFKGAIDSATALMEHWEAVVDVGKALVGVLTLVKLYSIQTGASVTAIFQANAKFASLKGANGLKMLALGFKNVGIAAKTAGLMIKSAFMVNLPLVGFMAAFEILSNLISRYNKYSDAVRETVSEYNKSMYALKELKAAYSDTANASDNASKKEIANANGKREALEKLVEMMRKENLTIEFNVKDLSDSELEKYFKGSLQRYEQFLEGKKKLDVLYEKNIRDTYIVDNVEDDLKDYSNAASDLIAESDKIQESIVNLNAKYAELPESAKVAFKELEQIQADNTNVENIEERIKKLQQILNDITEYDPVTYKSKAKSGFDDEVSTIKKLVDLYKKAQRAKEELLTVKRVGNKYIYNGELAAIAKDLQTQYVKAIDKGVESGLSKAQARIQAAKNIQLQISTLQAKKEIDDFGAEILKTAGDYKFVLNVDKENTQKQVDTIDNIIQRTIGDKTYKIRIATSKTIFDEIADAVDDAGKLVDAAETWNKIISSEGGKNLSWGYVTSKDSNFADWYKNIYAKKGSKYSKGLADSAILYKSTLEAYSKYRQQLAQETLDAFNLTSKGQDKQNKKAAKEQRDILSEQIALLKEMQKRYEDLQSVMGKSDAIQSVLQYYSASLKNVKMPESIVKNFVPTKEGLIKALEDLLKTIPQTADNFKKRMDVRNTIAELKVQIDKEKLKTDLDTVKDEIERAFNGLSLYKNLKDIGLSDVEVNKMFGNITKSFADVRKEIESNFTSKFGADQTKWGKDVADQYVEQMNKLDKQIYDNSVSQFKELSKAYKDQLDERLKIDLWYAEERKKIEENEQLAKNPTLKDEYVRNLDKMRAQKSDEADWKQFQNSDFYIRIFENLDTTSSRVLKAMQEKLASLRSSLKNLSPEQLKQVVEQQEKIDNLLVQKNPFEGLVSGMKDYIKFAGQRKQLEKDYLQSLELENTIKSGKDTQTEAVESAKQRYELAVKIFGMYSPEAAAAERVLKVEQDKLDVVLKELVAQGKITEEYRKQLLAGEQAQQKLSKSISSIASGYREISGAVGEFTDMLSNFGVDIPEELTGALEGIGQTLDGLESIDVSKPFSIITGSIKTIAGIGNTIGSIFGFGNDDAKKEKEIQRLTREVEDLQRTYDNLKTSMDNAWDTTNLIKYKDEAIKNIQAQNANYQAMINAEKSKKDSDDDKIRQWQQAIEDNNKALEEIQESFIEQLGGFGSDANYKSAAQAFADAWVDAFNEGSDTLEALEDTFDDYFNNLLKKQIMMRAVSKYITPILEEIDKAVSEGSAGGNNGADVTREELEKIQQLKDMNLELMDDYLKNLFEVLGLTGSGKSSLSALQQGIQSITETTAQELQSILNSMRFFISQQTTDITAIRGLLATITAGNEQSEDSPMLRELKAQTTLIQDLRDIFQSIRFAGHPKGGYGIRVFMD